MTSVRVGIVSWNTSALLDRCLAALPAALAGVDAEIKVVDNASSDDSTEVAARHPGSRSFATPRTSATRAAMNQALAGTWCRSTDRAQPRHGAGAGHVGDTRRAPARRTRRRLGRPSPRVRRWWPPALRVPVPVVPPGRWSVLLVPPRRLRGGTGRRWWADGHDPHDRSTDIDWAIGAVHVIRASALARRSLRRAVVHVRRGRRAAAGSSPGAGGAAGSRPTWRSCT